MAFSMRLFEKIGETLRTLLSGRKITPDIWHTFTYSKLSHFTQLRRHPDHQHEKPSECDLKVYQDMLIYSFILDNFPAGARLLEVGGGDSRIIKWLKHRYEFWNLDKLEGVGNGLIDIADMTGFRLVRDYIGSFSREIADGYFDGIFSLSVIEHLPVKPHAIEAICNDMNRLLKPGGFSFHCIDVVLKNDGLKMHPLIDYLYDTERIINPRISESLIRNDPDLWGLTEAGYNKYWITGCGNLAYEHFGIPLSYNILWQKAS